MLTPADAQAAIPSLTPYEIIARAESAIGTVYSWGQESWVPDSPGTGGPDCSGLGLKCWEVPKTLYYQEEHNVNATFTRYTSYSFYNLAGPWKELDSRADLEMGDILVKNDGSSGHVTIYYSGDAWNSPIIYEAPGTELKIRRISRYLGSEYKPIRRDSMSSSGIVLDNPTAKSTGGSDVGGNWTRSTSVSGYWGTDYQVHAATTGTAWARWTPRLPSTGSYEIFMRWTAATDRSSGSTVTVNTASGSYNRYINQRINGSRWVSLGDLLLQVRLLNRIGQHHPIRHRGERLCRRRCGHVFLRRLARCGSDWRSGTLGGPALGRDRGVSIQFRDSSP